jgi:hypothetical protein
MWEEGFTVQDFGEGCNIQGQHLQRPWGLTWEVQRLCKGVLSWGVLLDTGNLDCNPMEHLSVDATSSCTLALLSMKWENRLSVSSDSFFTWCSSLVYLYLCISILLFFLSVHLPSVSHCLVIYHIPIYHLFIFVYLSIYLSIYVSMYLSMYVSMYLSSIYLSTYSIICSSNRVELLQINISHLFLHLHLKSFLFFL